MKGKMGDENGEYWDRSRKFGFNKEMGDYAEGFWRVGDIGWAGTGMETF
jgi:hypothetical protein